MELVDAENPQITVLVDCEGLTPFKVPMQMMRYCSSLLQDHFPNRLGCLFVIRLPPVVRLLAQTFIQVRLSSSYLISFFLPDNFIMNQLFAVVLNENGDFSFRF